jgi:hypothetical protein
MRGYTRDLCSKNDCIHISTEMELTILQDVQVGFVMRLKKNMSRQMKRAEHTEI